MFLETICIKNGIVRNLEAHVFRMEQTAEHFGFIAPALPHLELMLPKSLIDKKVKCRVQYKETIQHVEFEAYAPKEIQSLRLVQANDLNYSFKFSDRSQLNLNLSKENSSEALIVQNGCITDTTYSNVVFRRNNEFFTPDTYLLNGTKRRKLLSESVIRETRITVDNLRDFDHVYLINSMLDIEDKVGCPVRDIKPGCFEFQLEVNNPHGSFKPPCGQ
ncbi:MAG: aminotransferase class IV [Bacteroidia bacterium]|nr:aminotransferase class IV [Bacteroidia bacterium]